MAPRTSLSFVRSSASFLSRSFLSAQQSFDGCVAAVTGSAWQPLQDGPASRCSSQAEQPAAPQLRRDAQGLPLPVRGAHGSGRLSAHGCVLLVAYAAAAAAYLAARLTLGLGAWRWLSWCLLAGELGCVARVLHHGLHFVRRPQTYIDQADLLYYNRYSFHVICIIPCYNEALRLVAPTVLAAAAAALPPGCTKEIWLCDDGQDAAKAAWVAGLDLQDCPVHYSTGRPKRPSRNGKSCNMNWALRESIYPNYPNEDVPNNHVLAFFDADQACVPDFFLLTLPYLVSARDALVQCPQSFFNYFSDADVLDHSARLKWVCRDAMVRGLGGLHCNGSGLVVRARALARIGWWAEWTVCEDNMMAMQLQRRGYRGYFVNTRVAHGQVPETVADSFEQRARFIKGYITNTISRHGMCWDTAHPLLLRILGNALTRDLYIVYMPLLLLPPVLGLLATPAGCDAAGERVAAAAGFAFHPLLPWAWLAHYVTAQVILQWHVLKAFGTSVWTNWLSHLFATHHFWPLTITCFAEVLHADYVRRQPLEFSVTPKRAALAAALDWLHTSGDLGEETADDLDGVRAANAAEHLQTLQNGISLHGSFCSVDAGRGGRAGEVSLGEKGVAAEGMAGMGGGNAHELLVDATASASSTPHAAWSSEAGTSVAYTYSGCPGDVTFPWRWLWVHVLVLLGSLAAAGKGAWVLATQHACGCSVQPVVVVQVVWCLHNSLAPSMLLARALHGDSPLLRSACWLLPRAVLVVGCVTWLWLVV